MRLAVLLIIPGCLIVAADDRWPLVRSQKTGNSETKIVQGVNGREVPVESVDEHILTDTPDLKVVERVIKRFDPNGREAGRELERIETRRMPDGSERVTRTKTRVNLNGKNEVYERSVAITSKTSTGTETVRNIERPTLNGRFDLVRRETTSFAKTSGNSTLETTVVAELDANGRFSNTGRTVVQSSENEISMAEYTFNGTSFELIRQSVRRFSPGSLSAVEVDTFEPAIPGHAASSQPQLTKRQLIERTATPSGIVETTRVQLADPSNPGKLTPPRFAERSTCSGECR